MARKPYHKAPDEHMTRQKTIAVAMSGGVDSSVAAALLREQGHEVFGVTMRLRADAITGIGEETGCIRSPALDDAAAVAALLGIRHEVVHLEEEFHRRIVGPFADAYLAGLTPNPCVRCNREIKFGLLWERARSLGAEALATGHYCRLESVADGRVAMLKASDRAKDQSYFLFELGQEELRRAVFPLGEKKKKEVRALAAELGLPVKDKAESREICFVGEGEYEALIARLRPGIDLSGEIVGRDGRVLGRHGGFHRFTVGQRRGLGIPADRPLYVLAIDAQSRRVYVGHKEDLERTEFIVSGVNWVSVPPPDEPIEAEVKIRYRAEPAPAVVEPLDGGRAGIRLREPRRGVAPGQAAVFYRDDKLLGGGWIEPRRDWRSAN